MFIDTHAHLDFDVYEEDREKVIQRAIESQVLAIITIGTDLESSRRAILLAEKYASIYAAVGIHPGDCARTSPRDFSVIRDLGRHPKVVAIGEIGLDYYRMHAEAEMQKEVFKKQITIARDLNLPVIVHNRDSHGDVLEILTKQGGLELSGVLHSFSGDEDFLQAVINLNFYLSFTGNLTYKKNTSLPLIQKVPIANLLLETDSPFLSPVPLRGKRNEPAYVVHIARRIAEIKEIELDILSKVTTDNAKTLFKLDI